MELRSLVLETVAENQDIEGFEETIKWGEASYQAKHGSTLRIGAPQAEANQYAIYFHCQTKLVPTFKKLYPNTFRFEANRAIIFERTDTIPKIELKHCIELSLRYHKQKKRAPFV